MDQRWGHVQRFYHEKDGVCYRCFDKHTEGREGSKIKEFEKLLTEYREIKTKIMNARNKGKSTKNLEVEKARLVSKMDKLRKKTS